jgi:hypothetical protein
VQLNRGGGGGGFVNRVWSFFFCASSESSGGPLHCSLWWLRDTLNSREKKCHGHSASLPPWRPLRLMQESPSPPVPKTEAVVTLAFLGLRTGVCEEKRTCRFGPPDGAGVVFSF